MIKKLFLIIALLSLCLPALAKKSEDKIILSNQKFKPQNISVLKKNWSQGLKAGSPGKRYYPETSNPIEDSGTLYVGTQGKIFYAINNSTGKIIWEFKNDEPISSTASLSSDKVFFTDLGGNLICLDKNSGTQVWKQNFNKEMLGKPLVTGNKLYLLKGEHDITAVSTADGSLLWSKTVNTYVRDITMRGHSSLVLDGDSLFFGLADGHLYRLSTGDGSILWDKNISVPLRTFKDIDAAVLVQGDSLYVGGYFGSFYRTNKSSGATVWSSDIATANTALILDNKVILSDTNGSVAALNKDDGKQLWYNELESGVVSAPVSFDNKIFVSSFKKGGFLLDPQTGNQIQKINFGDGSINTPVTTTEHIVVLSNSAQLMALGAK